MTEERLVDLANRIASLWMSMRSHREPDRVFMRRDYADAMWAAREIVSAVVIVQHDIMFRGFGVEIEGEAEAFPASKEGGAP